MRRDCTTSAGNRRVAVAIALAALLAGCPRPPRPPAEPPAPAVSSEPREPLPADARLFRVVPDESLVSILVYRAGKLARAGHNHLIASRDVTGWVVWTPDVARSSFELRMPVASLAIDDPELRRAVGPEFCAEVPESARQGTHRNMLGPQVLDGESFPAVTLVSMRIEAAPGGALATVQVTVRDQTRRLSVPVRYEQKGEELLADGELAVRQTELGLTPFTALLGALQVQDEMKVRFRILARAAT